MHNVRKQEVFDWRVLHLIFKLHALGVALIVFSIINYMSLLSIIKLILLIMKIRIVLLLIILPLWATAQNTVDSLIYVKSSSIFFDTDSFNLTENHKRSLDSLLILNSDDKFNFSIESYTDNVGSNEYNLKLSRKRGQSLIDFLTQKDIPMDWILSKDHGESSPISSNESDEGRSRNRRVVVRKYRVKKLQWISGVVKDETTDKGIISKVKLHAKAFKYESSTDSSGKFKVLGPINEVVGIDVRAKGYFLHSQMLKATPNISNKSIDIPVPPIEIGKSMNLDKLFFEGNKDVLLPKSLEIFEDLELFMKENDEICVEIGGHINQPNRPKVSKDSWDYYLSVARAKKIYDKLLENKVEAERMVSKGFGNWEMIYPKARGESKMAKNRRVEITVLKCDTLKSISNDTVPKGMEFSSGIPSNW